MAEFNMSPKDAIELGRLRKNQRIESLDDELKGWLKHIPDSYQTPWLKCKVSDASFRERYKAMCQRCVGYENVINEIRDCSNKECPLWEERPYRSN